MKEKAQGSHTVTRPLAVHSGEWGHTRDSGLVSAVGISAAAVARSALASRSPGYELYAFPPLLSLDTWPLYSWAMKSGNERDGWIVRLNDQRSHSI